MRRKRYSYIIILPIFVIIVKWVIRYDYEMSKKNIINQLKLEVDIQDKTITVDIKNPSEHSVTVGMPYLLAQKFTEASDTTKTPIITKTTIKNILLWTLPDHGPLMYLKDGQETFIERKCKVNNCNIIRNKTYFKDVSEFDVVLFNGPELVDKKNPKLPRSRSSKQKYVFVSIESSAFYPVCDNRFDGYFNITWTYKLDSDIFYGYLIIRDDKGEIIGPKQEIHWLNRIEMKPVNDTVKQKLQTKKKLAAWLVSNCNAPNRRHAYVKSVNTALRQLNLTTDMVVDIFGACGKRICGLYNPIKLSRCINYFESDYYFYFSFENSFSEDYVTEKVLHGLQHYTVPVVYGLANYSRFMPEGSYLNALYYSPEELANEMIDIINNKETYYSYFQWMNHYSYHYLEVSPETDYFCKFCEAMNDENLMNHSTVIEKFKEWWNSPYVRAGVCPPRY